MDNNNNIVPCGKCNFCLQAKRAEWTFRLQMEHRSAQTAYFLTYTYQDENLPISEGGLATLQKTDYQLFLKRLRVRNPVPIRYYGVGEYGSISSRPHYHLIVFNLLPEVVKQFPSIWGKGLTHVGDVNASSIHYVTKYVINRSGDWSGREPPFSTMSRRPGIGAEYLRTHRDWHLNGMRNYTSCNGELTRLPRYYKDKFFTPPERAENYDAEVQRLQDRNRVSYSREVMFTEGRKLADARMSEEIDRLSAFHHDPFNYYFERIQNAHATITSKNANKFDKF